MVPGDVIEWTQTIKRHKFNVPMDTFLWSSTMHRYVPIGSNLTHILVSIDNERMSWLNERGLFHAYVDDTSPGLIDHLGRKVLSRKRKM